MLQSVCHNGWPWKVCLSGKGIVAWWDMRHGEWKAQPLSAAPASRRERSWPMTGWIPGSEDVTCVDDASRQRLQGRVQGARDATSLYHLVNDVVPLNLGCFIVPCRQLWQVWEFF